MNAFNASNKNNAIPDLPALNRNLSNIPYFDRLNSC